MLCDVFAQEVHKKTVVDFLVKAHVRFVGMEFDHEYWCVITEVRLRLWNATPFNVYLCNSCVGEDECGGSELIRWATGKLLSKMKQNISFANF